MYGTSLSRAAGWAVGPLPECPSSPTGAALFS